MGSSDWDTVKKSHLTHLQLGGILLRDHTVLSTTLLWWMEKEASACKGTIRVKSAEYGAQRGCCIQTLGTLEFCMIVTDETQLSPLCWRMNINSEETSGEVRWTEDTNILL